MSVWNDLFQQLFHQITLHRPGFFSWDGPLGQQQEDQKRAGCWPQRCNSWEEKLDARVWVARLTPASWCWATRVGPQQVASDGFAPAVGQNTPPRQPQVRILAEFRLDEFTHLSSVLLQDNKCTLLHWQVEQFFSWKWHRPFGLIGTPTIQTKKSSSWNY